MLVLLLCYGMSQRWCDKAAPPPYEPGTLGRKKGSAKNKKKIMAAAHMDEIGLQATKIEPSGLIKVKTLGFLWADTTYMSRIKFRSGITGITIVTRYPHGPNSMANMEDIEASAKLLSMHVNRNFSFSYL